MELRRMIASAAVGAAGVVVPAVVVGGAPAEAQPGGSQVTCQATSGSFTLSTPHHTVTVTSGHAPPWCEAAPPPAPS